MGAMAAERIGKVCIPTVDPWIGLMDGAADFPEDLDLAELAPYLDGRLAIWRVPTGGNWLVELHLDASRPAGLHRAGAMHLASSGHWFAADYESLLGGPAELIERGEDPDYSAAVPPGHYKLDVAATDDWAAADQRLVYQAEDFGVETHYVVTLRPIPPTRERQASPFGD